MIRRQRPALVHAWLPPPVTVPTMIAAFLERVPVVFSYRNRMWFRDWGRIAEFFCALFAVKGIASNNPVEQSSHPYRLLYRMKSGVFIPNASVLSEDLKNSHVGSGARGLRILAAGRLTHQKNFGTLLAALEALPATGDWHCDIYGDGEDRTRLDSVCRAHRHKSRIASWYEGAPNVVLEAAHIGLPVLSSDIPAHRALYGGQAHSWMFPPGDSERLGALLNRLLGEKTELAEIKSGQAGLAKALSPAEAATAYLAYYDAVLNKHSRRN